MRLAPLLAVEFSAEVVAALAVKTNGALLNGRAMSKYTERLVLLAMVPSVQLIVTPVREQPALIAPTVPST